MSVIGRWRNEYGSVLDIRAHASSGEFTGVYASDTGASGVYLVRGWAPHGGPAGANLPFCAALSWKPTDGDAPDPSWGWVSVMAGVLFFDAPAGPPRVQTLHGLVASAPLEAVEIAAASVFTETLTFQRIDGVSTSPATSAPAVSLPGGDAGAARGAPLDLILVNQDELSRFRRIRLAADGDGRVEAALELDGAAAVASGFIDPAPGGRRQSLALAALISGATPRAVSLGGFIDSGAGTATLQLFEAGAVRFENKYTAVAIGQELFSLA